MRIWSLHPEYLDSKGLVALWRETLLAKYVLEGKTKGCKNHPQLERFKMSKHPSHAINQYLAGIYLEAQRREYNFDKEKIDWDFKPAYLTLTKAQLDYEVKHLLNKLFVRDRKKYNELKIRKTINAHPLFVVVSGKIENWERVATHKRAAGSGL